MTRGFLLVGLTGGIATGKSFVSQLLRQRGCVIIDADVLAREAVAPGEPALARIAEAFGGDVITPDGALDRRKLGAIVFADPAKRKRLEEIVHPAIRERFAQQVADLEKRGFTGLVFYDAAILIESLNDKSVEKIVVVTTDEATQRARLIARDGIDSAEVERRIASQMPLAEKIELADYVIDNSGDRAATEAQLERVLQALEADRVARGRLAAQPPSA
jgi:dephospho-CoA kinase